jgi:predicted DNA-binding transcriptional regulator AlpA
MITPSFEILLEQVGLLSRDQILALIPMSFSEIGKLEIAGKFPKRVVLPTGEHAWRRGAVVAWIVELQDFLTAA